MKKPKAKQDDSVQRENVRRAQEAGKRQAATSARRSVDDDRNSRRFVPDRHVNNDPQGMQSHVSVPVPALIRRAFVFAVVIVGVGLVLYALIKNLASGLPIPLPLALSSQRAEETPTSAPPAQRIGIVSGHKGNDSGSVCQDGLTEAQVNYDIAVRVATMLRSQGYTVDILDEFDARLKGYHAALLLSVHADSCTYVNDLATGFKVARVLDSKIPQEEDRLVACLTTRYMASTGLRFHQNTVTFDMTKYHAFYEIDERTPGAIIETGFLYLDRQVLTQKPQLVAQGIYDGLICFLNNQQGMRSRENPKSS